MNKHNRNQKVLFDLTAMEPNATGSRFHGAAEYAKHIFWCLTNKFEDIEVDGIYTKKEIIETCDKLIAGKHTVQYIPIQSHQDITKVLAANNYDVFFSALPYDYSDIKFPQGTRFVYTIHGIRMTEKPFDRYMLYYDKINLKSVFLYVKKFLFRKRNEKKYADKIERLLAVTENRSILTGSNHSKYSILLNCKGVSEEEITVLHSPTGIRTVEEEKAAADKGIINKLGIKEKKYFLMVSCNRWIKNCYRAMAAFDQLYSERPDLLKDYRVVLLGITDQCSFTKKIRNKDKFVLSGYVDDAELQELYKEAYASVYPTLNEGYGYPPVESMKYHTPSLCSAVSAIVEVCGDAACYFNPYDRMEIKNRICQILNSDIREEYIKRGEERYKTVNEFQKRDLMQICKMISEG